MENNYKDDFLNCASKLDAVANECGNLTEYAKLIVEKDDEVATLLLLKRISCLNETGKHSVQIKQISKLLKDSLYKYYGYKKVSNICNQEQVDEDCRTLEELLQDLHNLVGLKAVKEKIDNLIAYQKVQMLRKEAGLIIPKNTLHLAFTGKPGTGKTTVARIVGRIYKKIGLLSKGHFLEVSRTDLIAGYQGQTALKVKKVIEKAKGGVLFIDEAYSITENDHSDSYGRECLTELTKALEDYRDDLVVIVAGYTDPMNKFFESNPGLKSRFNTFIEFDDYSVEELDAILCSMCKESDYTLSEEVLAKINDTFQEQILNKAENFANGRLVRNVYEDLIMNHAKRVSKIDTPTNEDLSVILEDDSPALGIVVAT